ncbi:MAG: acyltransferase [Hyphomicrobiales bacterium]|nr:acyltransferase [Hyphomicrobiales bacterium]
MSISEVEAIRPAGAIEAARRERVATSTSGRLLYADALRGAACLMVVLYHAIGNDAAHGVHAAAGSLAWWVARIVEIFQLPLFAFVSGRVFVIATADAAGFRAGLLRKTMRLALPLVSTTLLMVAVLHLTGRSNPPSPWAALTTPFEHLWYLQATLWLTFAAAAGSFLFRRHLPIFAAGALAATCLAAFLIPVDFPNTMSLRGAIMLSPFFFLGVWMKDGVAGRPTRIEGALDPIVIPGVGLLICLAVLGLWSLPDPWADTIEAQRFHLLLAMAGVLLASAFALRSKTLAALSDRSLTIYLFHVFFLPPARAAVLTAWPSAPNEVVVAAALVAGVAAPWLMHPWIARIPIAALAFHGIMPKRQG